MVSTSHLVLLTFKSLCELLFLYLHIFNSISNFPVRCWNSIFCILSREIAVCRPYGLSDIPFSPSKVCWYIEQPNISIHIFVNRAKTQIFIARIESVFSMCRVTWSKPCWGKINMDLSSRTLENQKSTFWVFVKYLDEEKNKSTKHF